MARLATTARSSPEAKWARSSLALAIPEAHRRAVEPEAIDEPRPQETPVLLAHAFRRVHVQREGRRPRSRLRHVIEPGLVTRARGRGGAAPLDVREPAVELGSRDAFGSLLDALAKQGWEPVQMGPAHRRERQRRDVGERRVTPAARRGQLLPRSLAILDQVPFVVEQK